MDFEISCGKTKLNKHTYKLTNRRINDAERPTHASAVGVGNETHTATHISYFSVNNKTANSPLYTSVNQDCILIAVNTEMNTEYINCN